MPQTPKENAAILRAGRAQLGTGSRKAAQTRVLGYLRAGMTPGDAMAAVHRSKPLYYEWRKPAKFGDVARTFAAQADRAIEQSRASSQKLRDAMKHGGPDMATRIDRANYPTFTEYLVAFRKRYFGFNTFHHLQRMFDAMEKAGPGSITMILMPPEWMKDQSNDTPIPTPTGWTTVGDLRVGDEVFGRDGAVRRVVGVFPKDRHRMYRLTFSDGSTNNCGAQHLWLTRTRKPQHGESVKTTEEVVATLYAHGRPNHGVPVAEALRLPEADLSVDPYVLGYWLGDGTTTSGRFTVAPGDQPALMAELGRAGFLPHSLKVPMSIGTYGLQRALRLLGVLGNKHIPLAYLRASYGQRLALLQGLMDSDGTCEPRGRVYFCSKNEHLADQVEELVHTLGLKVRRHKQAAILNGVDHGPAFYVSVWPRRASIFRLERKAANQHLETSNDRDRWMTITGAEEILSVPSTCIAVDAEDGLYVWGKQFLVTHNTTCLEDYVCADICANPNTRIAWVTEGQPLARKSAGRIQRRLDDESEGNDLAAHFGPFRAPDSNVSRPWNADFFTVLAADHDERDYTFATAGIKSTIRGARWDTIIIDDPQSIRSMSETKRMVEIFRTDIVTRPGKEGRIFIIMSRVGQGDFAEALLEADIVDELVCIPALDLSKPVGEQSNFPLQWEEDGLPLVDEKGQQLGWSDEQLAHRRVVVGEEAWSRVYMQEPISKAGQMVTEQEILRACDRTRAVGERPTAEVIGSLDPALKRYAAFTVCSYDAQNLYVVDVRALFQPARLETLFDEVERLTAKYHPAMWAIESNNLGEAFLTSDSYLAIQEQYGFRSIPHHTGTQKADSSIGIPAMMNAIVRKEIRFPGAGGALLDPGFVALYDQLTKWRPDIPTKMLTQDLVMALWFSWTLWRQLRERLTINMSNWRRPGLTVITHYPYAHSNLEVNGEEVRDALPPPLTYDERWAQLANHG